VVKDETINIPRLGARQKDKAYMPVMVPGETVAFYMNMPVLFNETTFDNWTLAIAGTDNQVVDDIGVLQKDTVSGSLFAVLSEFVVPSIEPGVYQLLILNETSVVCMSNWVQVISADIADIITCQVSYSNSRNMYAFRWAQFPLFQQKIRLHLSLKDWEPEGNLTQYREVSTGLLRNEKYELDQLLKLETYYFDDAAHAAMAVLMACDNISINNRAYKAKSVYKPNTSDQSQISRGTVELYDIEYSKINKYGLQNN